MAVGEENNRNVMVSWSGYLVGVQDEAGLLNLL